MKRFVWPTQVALIAALLLLVLALAGCSVKIPRLPTGPATKAPTPMLPSAKQAPLPTAVAPTKAPAATQPAAGPQVPTSAPTVKAAQVVTATTTTTTTLALEGTRWKLVSYADAKGQTIQALPNSEVTAQFQDGKISGTDGCNQYTGAYKTAEKVLTIKLGASTLMACDAKIMAQAKDYAAALTSSATYQITGKQLQVTGGAGKVVLTYTALTPAPAAGLTPGLTPTVITTRTVTITLATTTTLKLEGVSWKAVSLADNKGAAQPLQPGAEITALFQGGRIIGSAGCNNYSAPYKLSGTTLTISPAVATTRKACLQPVMQQETAYLTALVKAVAYKIEGDKLELRNASGGIIASYAAPQPAVPAAKGPTPTPTPTPTSAPTAKATVATAPAAGAGLTGTTWKWVRFVDASSASEIATPDKYTIQFSADGKITVVADCNKASGTYKIEGSRLIMMLNSVTWAACPAGSLSDKFVKNFALTTLYFLDGDNLFVQLLGDGGILKFAKGVPVK